ncbi:TPA: hypothetical protein P9I81_000575 [Klebsiella pneumoniae]|nr:hypothetical protein [Klebsiella pneumoniae]
MTERGMIFNSEMVRAILDGRKTQTRRVMNVQPESNQFGLLHITSSTKRSDIGKYHWAESNATGNHVRSKLFSCPFGSVGDRIWVRETWQAIHDYCDENGHVDERRYARSIPRHRGNYWHPVYEESWGNENREDREFPWRPSIHMPRWASRILLEITDVRVERLRSMSQDDARAEGVIAASGPMEAGLAFRELWDSIYGEESWKANPWVWVIEFKRVEGGTA